MKTLRSRVAAEWCRLTHPAPMWPVNGYYKCPVCLHAYPVPWEHPAKTVEPAQKREEAVTHPAHAVAALASR